MRKRYWPLLTVLAVFFGGCAEQVAPRLMYVTTKTPGLMYVIVRPSPSTPKNLAVTQPGGDPITPSSEYLLLCDGRFEDGMRCEIPPEVSLGRRSGGPSAPKAPSRIEEEIGGATVIGRGDLVVQSTATVVHERSEGPTATATATPTAAPPPAATTQEGEKK